MTAAADPSPVPTFRSKAWIVYAALAAMCLIGMVSGSASFGTFLVGAACAAYATYIYRGGTMVFVPLPAFIAVPLGMARGVRNIRNR